MGAMYYGFGIGDLIWFNEAFSVPIPPNEFVLPSTWLPVSNPGSPGLIVKLDPDGDHATILHGDRLYRVWLAVAKRME